MSDVLTRLKKCNSGMGVRNPALYSFFMSVTEANEVADKIAELQQEKEELKSNLTELMAMWSGTARLHDLPIGDKTQAALLRDNIHDLKGILAGDLSCIERIGE